MTLLSFAGQARRRSPLWAMGVVVLAASSLGMGCGETVQDQETAPAESGIIGARVRLLMIAEPAGERAMVKALSNRLGALLAGRAEIVQSTSEWAAARSRLSRAGLRAVIVPRDQLAAIEASLNALPAGSELTLSQSARWTPVAVGAPLPDPGLVRVHDGLLTLSGGRLRLLLRCYAAPWGESPDGKVPAALRVDMVPQHEAETRSASDFASMLEPPRVRTIEDSGQILSSLAYESILGPDEVLLIVPEEPDVVWRNASGERSHAEDSARFGDPGPLALDKPAPPAPPQSIEFGGGPRPPRPKTVGEWVLTDASDLSDATRRLIVVIDPILPAEFRLLAPRR